ncbi:MAG TPA: hypothetical protein PKE64_28215, partial [Anaerolineae bacterium]|nr:hypothetical protein [Anaerolineae bacterium]
MAQITIGSKLMLLFITMFLFACNPFCSMAGGLSDILFSSNYPAEMMVDVANGAIRTLRTDDLEGYIGAP